MYYGMKVASSSETQAIRAEFPNQRIIDQPHGGDSRLEAENSGGLSPSGDLTQYSQKSTVLALVNWQIPDINVALLSKATSAEAWCSMTADRRSETICSSYGKVAQ